MFWVSQSSRSRHGSLDRYSKIVKVVKVQDTISYVTSDDLKWIQAWRVEAAQTSDDIGTVCRSCQSKVWCKLSGESRFLASTLRYVKGNAQWPLNTDLWSRLLFPCVSKTSNFKAAKYRAFIIHLNLYRQTGGLMGNGCNQQDVQENNVGVTSSRAASVYAPPTGQSTQINKQKGADPRQTTFWYPFPVWHQGTLRPLVNTSRFASCVERC